MKHKFIKRGMIAALCVMMIFDVTQTYVSAKPFNSEFVDRKMSWSGTKEVKCTVITTVTQPTEGSYPNVNVGLFNSEGRILASATKFGKTNREFSYAKATTKKTKAKNVATVRPRHYSTSEKSGKGKIIADTGYLKYKCGDCYSIESE